MPPRKARGAAAHSAGDSPRVDQVGGQIGANAIQNTASKQGSGRGILAADELSTLGVSDGVYFAGTIVPRDGGYFAFDKNAEFNVRDGMMITAKQIPDRVKHGK
jgi:hypothetical protein